MSSAWQRRYNILTTKVSPTGTKRIGTHCLVIQMRAISASCSRKLPQTEIHNRNFLVSYLFSTLHPRLLNSLSIGCHNLCTCRKWSLAHLQNESEAGKSMPCHFHTDQQDIVWLSGPHCPRRLLHREHRPLVFWATFYGQTSGIRKSGTRMDTWDSRVDYLHQCLAAQGACCCSRDRTVALDER